MTPVTCEILQKAYDDLSPFEKAAVDKRLAKYSGAPAEDGKAAPKVTGAWDWLPAIVRENPLLWIGGAGAAALLWWQS